jgi:hypothetical protein
VEKRQAQDHAVSAVCLTNLLGVSSWSMEGVAGKDLRERGLETRIAGRRKPATRNSAAELSQRAEPEEERRRRVERRAQEWDGIEE